MDISMHSNSIRASPPGTQHHGTTTTPVCVGFCTLGARDPHFATLDEVKLVDVDYVVKFAEACKEAGVQHMNLISALLADSKSRINYSRIKGEAISALEELEFDRLSVYKPSYVVTPTPREFSLSDRINRLVHTLIADFLPLRYRHLTSEELVRAMILNVETCECDDRVEHLTFVDMMKIVGNVPPT
eukprot:GHVS01095982.1.p1 GENE.GHVS01095982.1~~GHVS01095982.1.p1  ORF type:complete len:210 (+),score=19.89 GHVS01095982.1:71-631(+)